MIINMIKLTVPVHAAYLLFHWNV